MTKESKAPRDKDYSPHEIWCDIENNISDRCNCMVSGYIEHIQALEAKLALCLNALERHSDNCMRQLDGCYLCAALAKIRGENDKE